MKKLGRIVFYGVACVIVMAVAAITLTIGWRPFVGPRARSVTNKQFERTPERLARGQYLVRGLLGCEVCHTVSDWTQHGAPRTSAGNWRDRISRCQAFLERRWRPISRPTRKPARRT